VTLGPTEGVLVGEGVSVGVALGVGVAVPGVGEGVPVVATVAEPVGFGVPAVATMVALAAVADLEGAGVAAVGDALASVGLACAAVAVASAVGVDGTEVAVGSWVAVAVAVGTVVAVLVAVGTVVAVAATGLLEVTAGWGSGVPAACTGTGTAAVITIAARRGRSRIRTNAARCRGMAEGSVQLRRELAPSESASCLTAPLDDRCGL
jgi:hypothetical protein